MGYSAHRRAWTKRTESASFKTKEDPQDLQMSGKGEDSSYGTVNQETTSKSLSGWWPLSPPHSMTTDRKADVAIA